MVTDISDQLNPEVSVIGAMLVDQSVIGGCIQKLDAEDFTMLPCRIVYQTIRRMWASGMPVDPVTVRSQLDGFDNATGFIVDAMQIVPNCQNIDRYVAAVKTNAAMAAIRGIAEKIQAAQTVEEMTQLLAKANAVSVQKKERVCMSAAEMLKSFAEDHASETAPKYYQWAFDKLTEKMYAEPGDMVIIAGRPSDGKTAFALVNAWEQAKSYRVGFYSLETGAKKIRDRSMANLLGIDLGSIKTNHLSNDDWERYGARSGGISARTFWCIEAAGMTVDEIFADAVSRRFEIIYIDYLQIIRPTNSRDINRTSIVADISIRIHQNSRSTGIMAVCMAQINRASVEGNKPRRPSLNDLKESGQIEQDADAVMFIWRQDADKNDATRNIFVAKNKEGRIGSFDLTMEGRYQRFADAPTAKMPAPKSRHNSTPVIGKIGADYEQLPMDTATPFDS